MIGKGGGAKKGRKISYKRNPMRFKTELMGLPGEYNNYTGTLSSRKK